MRYAARTQLLLLLLLVISFGPRFDVPHVNIHNATDIQMAQVAQALDRFDEAGLTLPPLELTFHDGSGPCHGHTGWYRRQGRVAHIEICSPTNHIILHELAHAWEGASVSDDVRREFADHWGVDSWNDHTTDWTERGTERAADTVAFVLEVVAISASPRRVADSILLSGSRNEDVSTGCCGSDAS